MNRVRLLDGIKKEVQKVVPVSFVVNETMDSNYADVASILGVVGYVINLRLINRV